ncbi:UBN2_2 domain-containing protein, partial [Cephalotus follicularis]
DRRGYVLEANIPISVAEDTSDEEKVTFLKWKEENEIVRCCMIAAMSYDLQCQHEQMTDSRAILLHLQELYGEKSRTARYHLSKDVFSTKMQEGASVNDHCVKMISCIEQLASLGFIQDA